MGHIDDIVGQIEDLGEKAKTVSGVTKNLKEIFSVVSEEEKQAIMKKLTERRIRFSEKQKKNLTNINYFIASITCKTNEELKDILDKRKTEEKEQKKQEKKERKTENRARKTEEKNRENEEKENRRKRKQEKDRKITKGTEVKEEKKERKEKKEQQEKTTESDEQEKNIKKSNKREKIQEKRKSILEKRKSKKAKNQPTENVQQESEQVVQDIDENLSKSEKEKLKTTFQDKSSAETEHIVKTTKDPWLKRIIKKISIAVGIAVVSGGLIVGIRTRAKKDAKNKRIYDTEQSTDQNKERHGDATKIIQQDPITIGQLQQAISQEQLQDITYQEIEDAVIAIPYPEIQKAAIEHIKKWDIFWLQEMYGMKRNSEYASNKASGKMDTQTLEKIRNPLFGAKWPEVMNNPKIPSDVKEAYQDFLTWKISNGNLPYLILSKSTCTQYLFTKEHRLTDKQTILIGADKGNTWPFQPYPYYKSGNGGLRYVKGEVNRNTPTGLFKIQEIIEGMQSNYKVDGPKRGIRIVPIDNQGNEEERFKYKQRWLAIHPIYQPPSNPDKYENAIVSGSIDDNDITHGCPNIPHFGIAYDNLSVGSKVYICRE